MRTIHKALIGAIFAVNLILLGLVAHGHIAPASAQIGGAPSVGGVIVVRGSADPTGCAGVACPRPCLYTRFGTDELYFKTGASATSWSKVAVSGGTIGALTSTGRITGAGFTSSVNGDATTPAYNFSSSAGTGHAFVASKLTSAVGGSAILEVQSTFVDTTVGIAYRTGGRLQAYTIHAANVTGQIDNYAPGEVSILQLNPTAARSMTGMVAVSLGDFKFIKNVAAAGSGFNLTLEHDHASSSAGNKFSGAGGADVVVPPQGLALAIYNGATSAWDAYLVN